ncbi:5'-nucleotidase [Alkalilimnicola ehrlichii]|uniref:5'-nucleotidase n=1 Tax=Alkalilimnicola ehrlichii TaxID=351052 RepID=A0A3E0WZQ1_9GAMM|nr:5'-nucleotidase [Alkalilimnicola ehrlichii]RFA28366.1 5'-nucleotidase [Alkalilimnicola ehrlichii]RFA38569.1 5'-nucleotidase [Alkalilimnicola ehrlichii]
MPTSLENQLVVAISSRALFDMSESHRIFVEEGVDAYCRYQIENEDEVLEPGVAFGLVKKLLALNKSRERTRVEVILLSRNSADTGLRVFNSIEHYQLDVTRAAFTNGESPYRYVPAFGAHLFLSSDPDDVVQALNRGYAAATILPGGAAMQEAGAAPEQLRIAFDGDAVLFADEAERVFRSQGLDGFSVSEREQAKQPLPGGPFKGFLAALHAIQAEESAEHCPIRTALVTARGAPAHERVIRTLRSWEIRIDEALFLGGLPKSEFLAAFGADIFFDDQQGHCELARHHVATGHVPHGVANENVISQA